MDPRLTRQDVFVLQNLLDRAQDVVAAESGPGEKSGRQATADWKQEGLSTEQGVDYDRRRDSGFAQISPRSTESEDEKTVAAIDALNAPGSQDFEPTVFVTWDLCELRPLTRKLLGPYVRWAGDTARHQTDAVFVTHLLLYFSTSLPSAIWLYYRFSYVHGILHWLMQSWYVGSYTLMRHNHIHQGGILNKRRLYSWIDASYAYITDPLHGHTWNSYYYHHVKHHHVEGNGPDDLSSTLRYQRDSFTDFLKYLARFFFCIWIDLPLYFVRRKRYTMALKAWGWEALNLACVACLARWQLRPTIFVFVLPFVMMRIGLMVGNWGQHALVDEMEPDSDFRSSITLIDVASNRFCFNDGYHTSHHLNPLRHWRDHPASLIKQKSSYSNEGALILKDIDYIMLTVRLFMKDYDHLARCLVPIGNQTHLNMKERAEMLRRKTRKFSEEEIVAKFGAKRE